MSGMKDQVLLTASGTEWLLPCIQEGWGGRGNIHIKISSCEMISPHRSGLTYRIAGNFRGAYISRIDIKFIFVVTNFADGNY